MMINETDLMVPVHDGPVRQSTEVAISREQAECQTEAWMNALKAGPALPLGRLLYAFVVKRCLDLLFGVCFLIITSPILLLIALAIIWEGKGPVLYRQQRIGRYGRPFSMYKFRTMTPDRRARAETFEGIERRRSHKTPNDPRVTTLGKVLRRTSLDELPQVINIIRGDMSFIGPRPELVPIVERYAPWQHERHLVRPGLSGWWQVHGRSDRPMHENTQLDIYYVEHLSVWLDMKVLWLTFGAVLDRSGAF